MISVEMDRHRLYAVSIWIALGLILGAACGPSRSQRERMAAVKLTRAGAVITSQASACLNAGRAVLSAWHYAEVSEIDRKQAEREMLGGAAQMRADLESGRIQVDRLINELGDPIEKYQEAHERLKQIHSVYLELHELVMKPSGSPGELEAALSDLQNRLYDHTRDFDALLADETR